MFESLDLSELFDFDISNEGAETPEFVTSFLDVMNGNTTTTYEASPDDVEVFNETGRVSITGAEVVEVAEVIPMHHKPTERVLGGLATAELTVVPDMVDVVDAFDVTIPRDLEAGDAALAA